MPSTTQFLKALSENKNNSNQSIDKYNFLNKNIGTNELKENKSKTPYSGRNLFDDSLSSKEEISQNETGPHNKSQRGLLYEHNKENMYIGNLIIKDDEIKVKSADTNKYDNALAEVKNRKHLNSEIINIKIQDTSKDGSLFQINENDLENLESSTEILKDLTSDRKNECNKPKLSNFIEDRPSKPIFSRDNTSSKKAAYNSRSSIKESLRYSEMDMDKEQSTLSKFIANIDFKYQINENTQAKLDNLKEEK